MKIGCVKIQNFEFATYNLQVPYLKVTKKSPFFSPK